MVNLARDLTVDLWIHPRCIDEVEFNADTAYGKLLPEEELQN